MTRSPSGVAKIGGRSTVDGTRSPPVGLVAPAAQLDVTDFG